MENGFIQGIESETKSNNKRRAALRWWLISLTLVVGVIALVLINQGLFRLSGAAPRVTVFDVSGEIIRKNELLTQLASELIKGRISKIATVGVAAAANKNFANMAVREQWDEAINSVVYVIKDVPSIDQILVTDILGTVMADYPGVIGARGQNLAFLDWYKGVTSRLSPYLSGAHQRAVEPKYNVVSYAFPVSDSAGKPVAFLVVQIRLDEFFAWAEEIQITPHSEFLVVDQRGRLIAQNNLQKEYAPQGEIIDLSSFKDIQLAVAGQFGSQVIFFNGTNILSSYWAIPEYGWSVVKRVPIDEIK